MIETLAVVNERGSRAQGALRKPTPAGGYRSPTPAALTSTPPTILPVLGQSGIGTAAYRMQDARMLHGCFAFYYTTEVCFAMFTNDANLEMISRSLVLISPAGKSLRLYAWARLYAGALLDAWTRLTGLALLRRHRRGRVLPHRHAVLSRHTVTGGQVCVRSRSTGRAKRRGAPGPTRDARRETPRERPGVARDLLFGEDNLCNRVAPVRRGRGHASPFP